MTLKKQAVKEKKVSLEPGTVGVYLLSELARTGASAFDEVFGWLRRYPGKKGTRRDDISIDEATARTTLWRLQKKGLIIRRARQYEATNEGVRMIDMLEAEETEVEWDGKWRIVMFDIPENKRHERNWLRHQLYLFEYHPLQKSVFVGKQPLEGEIYEWLTDHQLDRNVRLLTVGDIDFNLDSEWR